jgi:hypothetical protein
MTLTHASVSGVTDSKSYYLMFIIFDRIIN